MSKFISNTENIDSSYLGLIDYQKSIELQKKLLTQVQTTQKIYIIGLEHPAVITLGYRAIVDEEVFGSRLPLVRIERGGLATIHSEGQLVIYPVIDLRGLGLGVRDYVNLLLQTTQSLLKNRGVDSFLDEKAIGLYTQKGKIAFCGIQIKNGISQHGISLNVNNDIGLFSQIRSCGVEQPTFDRLADCGVQASLEDLYHEWILIFKNRLTEYSNVKPS